MEHLMREFLGYFWRLTPEEIIACELAHSTGYLSVPAPSRGWLENYYGTCCFIDQKPAVILMPERGKKRKLGASLPTREALPQIAQLAVDAGVAVSSVCPFRMGLVGFIDAARAEPVAKLISKRASFWCATYLGVMHDVH